MRLLNAETFSLEEFPDERSAPPYAILSHTWGEDEVSLQDIQALAQDDPRLDKIRNCCRQALSERFPSRFSSVYKGLDYIWVDTCCIDKTSSAELSEAINSMFRWYRQAKICYAYLSDVHGSDMGSEEFQKSRWFTRGWTLQELLAPYSIEFFNATWDKIDMNMSRIAKITGIQQGYLKSSRNFAEASIAERMSWAANRNTTRVEDMAYCLLGIFEVNMPMLYGEGIRAFSRLQEEIIKGSDDMTVFSWGFGLLSGPPHGGLFAESPASFSECKRIEYRSKDISPFMMTNVGLQVTLPVIYFEHVAFAILDRAGVGDYTLALPLTMQGNKSEGVFIREVGSVPLLVSPKLTQKAKKKAVYIRRKQVEFRGNKKLREINLSQLRQRGYKLVEAYPPSCLVSPEYGNITFDTSQEVYLHFSSDKEKHRFKITAVLGQTAESWGREYPKIWFATMREETILESLMTEETVQHPERILEPGRVHRRLYMPSEQSAHGTSLFELPCQFGCEIVTIVSVVSNPHYARINLFDAVNPSGPFTLKRCEYHSDISEKLN